MEITRNYVGGIVELAIEGRLDGYWADHLDSVLAEAVRDGHHRIRLDLSKVIFLSSAGIAVMVKFYKQLTKINGLLGVVNPSPTVLTVLQMTRLAPVLIEPPATEDATVPSIRVGRHVERGDIRFEVFTLASSAQLTCRAIGRPEPLTASGFTEEHCASLGSLTPALAVGVGAFGEGFAECRTRFGELISVSGATAYQPADGTNVADYLVSSGPLAPDVRVLYCLACEGAFSKLIRFESKQAGGTVGLASLLESCLELAGAPAVGVVIVAEAASLVGAALRRSPGQPVEERDFFAHPGIRTRLTFTAERAFLRTLTLSAGIVARAGGKAASPAAGGLDPAIAVQLRAIGADDCVGHVHAAAFPFRPVKKGEIDLKETVSGLFEAEHLLGVLHLLHDDRGAGGAGESEFIRGACWVGPIAGPGKER